MYVLEFGLNNEKIAIGVLAVFVMQVAIYCILKGAKECGKN